MSDSPSSFHTQPSLLVRIRDFQDPESWKTFVETYGPLIFRYCQRKGLQDADAADVTQEAMTEVARSIRNFQYQPERGRFRDWLGTIARRRLARFLESRSRTVSGPAEPLDECAAPQLDGEWTEEFNTQIVRIALQRIEKCFEAVTWQAFSLTWLENRPAAEVAASLQRPIESVYLAKSRVLKRLQDEILMLAEDVPQLVPLHE